MFKSTEYQSVMYSSELHRNFFLLEMQNEIQEIEQPVKEIKKRTSKPRKSMKSNNIKYQGFMRDLSWIKLATSLVREC